MQPDGTERIDFSRESAPGDARARRHDHVRDEMPRRVAELLVGNSVEIQRVRALIVRLAPTDLPIHIHGPTGSGKELVARALHLASRRPGRLVSINTSAISEGIFESAMFGHVRLLSASR